METFAQKCPSDPKASRRISEPFVLLRGAQSPNVCRMPVLARFLSLILLVTISRAALPFPHEGSDLAPDPAARFGTLPNGVRYVVYPNQEPKARASLRLLVQAG